LHRHFALSCGGVNVVHTFMFCLTCIL